MRPRKTENRDLPPGMYRRKRQKANGKVWEALYYRDKSGKDIFLGSDLVKAKAASEINDLGEASVLLGHSKEGITERVYRRVGAIAKPAK